MQTNSKTRSAKARFEVGEGRRLSFYACLFGEETLIGNEPGGPYRERIAPGAFSSTLASGREVVATVDHRPDQQFASRSAGELLLQEDPVGLFATCYVPQTALGDQIISDVRAGRLDGASFVFVPQEDKISRSDGVPLVERVRVELIDVCVTPTPAYKQTEGTVHLRSDKYTDFFRRLRLVKLKTTALDNSK